MQRVLEPEVMDADEQCEAYARADFTEPDQAFVERVLTVFPELSGRLVDLGCGPAQIPIRLVEARPGLHVTAVDASEAMLVHARAAVALAGLEERIELVAGRLPEVIDQLGRFDAVISNSLLHHLPIPEVLWMGISKLVGEGAPVLVVDLRRPGSIAEVEQLVATHSANEPEVLRQDFFNSLLAAFTTKEVRMQLDAANLSHLKVEEISDRHLAVFGRR